jgi:outer membrane protein OmpA-like peptidoglycan-associated protein
MRHFSSPLALAALILVGSAGPGMAQIQPDVTVNPNATGTKVLLYPGGKFGRVQRRLLQPGEADPAAPVVLHMPHKHKVHLAAAAQARTTAKARPKVRVAVAPPPPADDGQFLPPPESAASLLGTTPPARPKALPPKQPKTAPPKPPVAIAKQMPPPPRKPPPPPPSDSDTGLVSGVQNAQPSPPTAPGPSDTNVAQRSSILFSPGAEEPPPSALDTVKSMVAGLNAALGSGSGHIQLEAYGGAHSDKSSDARRLSLKRALIVRQLLIDDGIPSERIVVRAMGGASSGAPDRVDILVAA